MPINNPALYNAVIAGATGGAQDRWITQNLATDYLTFRTAVLAVATSVDGAIATSVDPITSSQVNLMQSITQGIFASRFLQSTVSGDYDSIADAIAALFAEQSGGLDPAGSAGGPSAPLSRVLYVDKNYTGTDSNGSIQAPFITLVDAIAAAEPGTALYINNADYSTEGPLSITKNLFFVGFILQPFLPAIASVGAAFGIQYCTVLGNVSSDIEIDLYDTNISGNVVITGGGSLLATGSIPGVYNVNGDVTVDGIINGTNFGFLGVTIAGGVALEGCSIGALTLTTVGGTSTFYNCGISNLIAITADATSFIHFDYLTNNNFQNAGASIVGATLKVLGALPVGTLSVTVPAIAAYGVAYADTAVPAGHILRGLKAGDAIVGNPTADLNTAGAGKGGFINCWVPSQDVIRCSFLGILPGGASNFRFSRLSEV